MSSTPYARLLLSLDGGDATAGASEATAEAAVQPVYESTAGWPATPPPYLEIFEYPVGWTPDPITGWVETGTAWRYYGATPPPAFAAPSLAQWGKVKMQLVVGGGRRAGVVSSEMTSEAMVYVRSAEGLESVAYREATELDALRSWVGALQRDLRLISTQLGAVSALTEAQLRAVSATLTAALPVNGKKITGLADGTTSTDAAAFGQIAAALTARTLNTTAPITGGGNLSADRTLAFAPSADVAMGGYGFTGCPSMANAAGDITCTPKSDSALVGRKDALTTTYSSCVAARNATAATSLATVQNGPVVCSEGSGWRTSSGGAAITVRGGIMAVPVSGSTVAARVYTVYDVGAGYSLGDYCTNSDPYLFGSARVVDTLVWTANGVRDANNGNGGIRNNGSNIQLTSGSTNEVQLATNSTVRLSIISTGEVDFYPNDAAPLHTEWAANATGKTPVWDLLASSVATSATGDFTVLSFTPQDGAVIEVDYTIICSKSGTDHAALRRQARWYRNGSTLTQLNTETIGTDVTAGVCASATSNSTASGSTLQLQVHTTDATAQTWTCIASVRQSK